MCCSAYPFRCYSQAYLQLSPIFIHQDGAIRIFLINASYAESTKNAVYFDDVKVVVKKYVTAIMQADDYDPFGLRMVGNHYQAHNTYEVKHLYNKKELQDDMGLDWYDYGARMYDMALGRWHVHDAHAEKYYSHSPYVYALNNPLRYIDPDGLDGLDVAKWGITFSVGVTWQVGGALLGKIWEPEEEDRPVYEYVPAVRQILESKETMELLDAQNAGVQLSREQEKKLAWGMFTLIMGAQSAPSLFKSGPGLARPQTVIGSQARAAVGTAAQNTDQVLMELRDQATNLTRRVSNSGAQFSPTKFGSVNDSIFKSLVKQAVQGGRLPATIRTSPSSMNVPGSRGIDVWDTATGRGWDLTTARSEQVLGHDLRYLGQAAPDGTIITDVTPMVYSR
jgi:RHS repeat-associated protein